VKDGHRTSTIARPRVSAASVDARTRVRGTAGRRSAKATTSGKTSGATTTRSSTRTPVRSGLISDFTTPIPRDKQILSHRRGRLALGLVATLIALAIGAALFVLPVKSWLHQRDDLRTRTSELQTLDAANNQLQSEVDRLQTEDGIREAARTEIDYVPKGEKRVTVMPVPSASPALPASWPYNLIGSIIALRQAEATAVAVAPATTVIAATTDAVAVTPASGVAQP
jgi:cell division protein FtsB